LDALIDEATRFQYKRAEDALQVKLRAYLEKEMRKWEKTFPDELRREFARVTNWHGDSDESSQESGHFGNEAGLRLLGCRRSEVAKRKRAKATKRAKLPSVAHKPHSGLAGVLVEMHLVEVLQE
jgi:hypothetical protein